VRGRNAVVVMVACIFGACGGTVVTLTGVATQPPASPAPTGSPVSSGGGPVTPLAPSPTPAATPSPASASSASEGPGTPTTASTPLPLASSQPSEPAGSPASTLVVPPATPLASQRPAGMFFGGALQAPEDGYSLSGSQLLLTADGGRSWVPRPLSGRHELILASAMSDLQHVWLVRADSPSPAGTPLQVVMDTTADAGQTWMSVLLPPVKGSAGSPTFVGTSISVVDDSVAFVLLNLFEPSGTGRPPIYTTADGGAAWTALPRGPAGATWVRFFDRSNGWTGKGTALWRTTDGGRTWAPQALPLPAGLNPRAALQGDPRAPVRTPDGRLVFVCFFLQPQVAAFFTSADGGATWTYTASSPTTGPGSDIEPVAAAIIDGDHWVIGGGPLLQVTADAGATWEPVQTSLPGQARQFSVADGTTLSADVTYGDSVTYQALWVSRDGGHAWADITP
jgi:photosystem II stability/assembly factor-like uncharacterized protein